MGSASSDSGIIEAGGVASSMTEDRLRRLELMEERREAAMAEFRKQVDRVEQAQAKMRITQATILLRVSGEWDVPAEEDDVNDDDNLQEDWLHVHLNWLRAAQQQLGLELIKVHKQETHVGEYAKLKRRIEGLEESLAK